MSFKLYRYPQVVLIEKDNFYEIIEEDWDDFINSESLVTRLKERTDKRLASKIAPDVISNPPLPPIGQQEVWAAGVTYFRSKEARVEESQTVGKHSGSFYDRVYEAARPELFFKATAARTVGTEASMYIRPDSTWNVPEPEFTVFANARREIIGYTIGNDLSSRDIEGENPLYLPQAKSWEKSAALGPCLLEPEDPKEASGDRDIHLRISRGSKIVWEERTNTNQMKRKPEELVAYLFRACEFPQGVFLMTGTGIIPPNDFSLQVGDRVEITIDTIGTLINTIELYQSPYA